VQGKDLHEFTLVLCGYQGPICPQNGLADCGALVGSADFNVPVGALDRSEGREAGGREEKEGGRGGRVM
jgi:hypothetical protein